MCPQHIDDTRASGGSADAPQGHCTQTLRFQSWKDLTGGSPKRGAEMGAQDPGSLSPALRSRLTPFWLRMPSAYRTGARRRACACRAPSAPVLRVGPSLTAVNTGFSSPSNSPAKPSSRLRTRTWRTVCRTQAVTAELTRVRGGDLSSETHREKPVLGTRGCRGWLDPRFPRHTLI